MKFKLIASYINDNPLYEQPGMRLAVVWIVGVICIINSADKLNRPYVVFN